MLKERELLLPLKHEAVLIKLNELFHNKHIIWALTGSTSFAVQGMDVEPHDIDIQTDKKSAYMIGELLKDYKVNAVALSSTDTIRSHFGVFDVDGLQVEIMGDIQKKSNGTWEDITDLNLLIDHVNYKDMLLPVINLSYESLAYRKLGRNERAEAIDEFVKTN